MKPCIMGCGRERLPGRSRCLECFRIYNKENRARWRAKNPERARELCQKYRENNRTLEASRSREYYARNVKNNPEQQEKARARAKAWYRKNREMVLQKKRAANRTKTKLPLQYCERLHASACELPCGKTPSCRGCSKCPEGSDYGSRAAFNQSERHFE